MTRGNRYKQIGIDRPVRLGWIDQTARLLSADTEDAQVVSTMTGILQNEFPNSDPLTRGSLSKTLTILLKTWVRVPYSLQSFRNRGLNLIDANPRSMAIAIHWGMLMSAYPFWGVVSAQTGRLLGLQENIAASQIQRRLRERYGERDTVSRRTRYALRSFVDWGVLQESLHKGAYKKGDILRINDKALVCWLMESCLNMQESSSMDMREIERHPSLFPFELTRITEQDLCEFIPGLVIDRHSLNEAVLTITSQSL